MQIILLALCVLLVFGSFESSYGMLEPDFEDGDKQRPSYQQIKKSSATLDLEKTEDLNPVKHEKSPTCIGKLYALFKDVYERSPINLSLLTGLSHLEIPRLKGGMMLGRYFHIEQEGLLSNLQEAAKLASAHSSGACHFWLGKENALLISKPAHIKQVLVYNNDNISRNRGIGDNIALVFGKSLFFDDGEIWKHKRSLWRKYLYMDKALKDYAPKMQALIRQYLPQDISEKSVDLQKFFTRFTLDVVGHTLMASDNLAQVAEYITSFLVTGLRNATSPQAAVRYKLQKLCQKLSLRKDPTSFDQLSKAMRDFFENNVLSPNEDKFKVMRCLLKAIHETQPKDDKDVLSRYSEAGIADCIFLAFAGHTTTSATFQFAVKLLAAHPLVVKKLREALHQELQSDSFTSEDVEKVKYLDWVIKETLRLFPPVSVISRGVTQAFSLTNIPVEANREGYTRSLRDYDPSSIYLARHTSVVISPYIMHRSEDLFKDATQFIPERFVNEKDIPPYAYIPFGAGPRFCLGQRFALQELKLMLTSIYYHFDIEIKNNDMTVDPFDITLTPHIKPMGRFVRVKS